MVDHFRPRNRASQLDGRVDPDHYWWLAYEWSNLYAACKACSNSKSSRFPVRGRRASSTSSANALAAEKAFLLDPCRETDEPEQNLTFLPDGTVSGITERARISIEVYGLNRVSLIQARREHSDLVNYVGDMYLGGEDPRRWKVDDFIRVCVKEMVAPVPFLALTRQHLRRYYDQAIATAAGAAGKPFKYRREETVEPYRGAIWLESIEIENFKALRELRVSFPSPQANSTDSHIDSDDQQPWLMLLGENGVGKSSVLKAVALALMPADQRSKLVANAGDLVTRSSRKQTGLIRLKFSVGATPFELRFKRGARRFVVKGNVPKVSLLGYGSTRLLPPATKATKSRPGRIRVGNLFSARADLANAETWLASRRLMKARNFNLLASSLRSLLSLEDDDRIQRYRGRLSARVSGEKVAIRELSDGYQSVMALTMDMMLNLSQATFDMRSVEGVVLLDELEVHLHPRWKIAIVSALRSMFPRVRFIVTTHDPLCLQGLKPGELHIMSRHPKSGRVVIDQVDVEPGLRADQILTGAWFGLPSTRDSGTLGLIHEHSTLLLKQKKDEHEANRQRELEEILKQRLTEYSGTAVETLGLQAAAEIEAETPVTEAVADREELRSRITDRLRQKQMAGKGDTDASVRGASKTE